ncbi:hypothetical protein BP6252_10210 [Coleophoma cylindrospora]|uniref:Uncharacterized protein n=1 Tax=Coleophoma cylindrospora TaxID=1849047 RepID=A0A3D8QXS9_9HELO|nr:hypothetical protein BP6252_10210 [Coleophoma cylindrospora]
MGKHTPSELVVDVTLGSRPGRRVFADGVVIPPSALCPLAGVHNLMHCRPVAAQSCGASDSEALASGTYKQSVQPCGNSPKILHRPLLQHPRPILVSGAIRNSARGGDSTAQAWAHGSGSADHLRRSSS